VRGVAFKRKQTGEGDKYKENSRRKVKERREKSMASAEESRRNASSASNSNDYLSTTEGSKNERWEHIIKEEGVVIKGGG